MDRVEESITILGMDRDITMECTTLIILHTMRGDDNTIMAGPTIGAIATIPSTTATTVTTESIKQTAAERFLERLDSFSRRYRDFGSHRSLRDCFAFDNSQQELWFFCYRLKDAPE